MSQDTKTPEQWGDEYRRRLPTYQSFAEKLRLLLCDLLDEAAIEIVQSEARGKDIDSFVNKIERKQERYAAPLTDITDLAGIRVIAYYTDDVAAIGKIIHEQFAVDVERSVQKGDDLDADRFGYVSDHYIVSLSEPRRDLAEWSAYASLVAEIQVRTATQHAWAAIDHKLGYKSAKQLPRELQRRLYRLSALFELADEQFSAARSATAELHEGYSATLRTGNLDVPLDLTSMTAYLEESPRMPAVRALIESCGGTISTDNDDPDRRSRDQSDLLASLTRRDLTTLQGLDELLARADEATERLRAYVTMEGEGFDGHTHGYLEDMVNVLAFLIWQAPLDEVAKVYAEGTAEVIERAGQT